jgi:hypothetical protein
MSKNTHDKRASYAPVQRSAREKLDDDAQRLEADAEKRDHVGMLSEVAVILTITSRNAWQCSHHATCSGGDTAQNHNTKTTHWLQVGHEHGLGDELLQLGRRERDATQLRVRTITA